MDDKKINSRFDKLESLINDLKTSLTERYKELDVKLNEVIKSQSFLSDKYEEIITRLDAVEQEKCAQSVEITSLKSQAIKSLNDIALLQQEVNNLEQYTRRDCLEIRGIPIQEEETAEALNKIVQRIGEEMGVHVHDHDISISHRLPSGRKRSTDDSRTRDPNPIIVKFTNRKVREDFYRARIYLRGKSTEILGFQDHNKIFIAESLTPKNKELFHHCLNFKREKGYRFIWTQMGKIFLRKDHKSRKFYVSSVKDLEKLDR